MTTSRKLPTPVAPRWQLLRAGIQNVWEYDDHRFVFEHGRLMLKGQNESGKTKALEVLLPFLLDASLQPKRLDPFGSTARPMRWNLLNDSNPGVNVAIGYVWVELGRLEDGVPCYWTLGAGLKARRAASDVEDWYFATPQRVDVDLHLLDETRVPLPKPRLASALGEKGQLFDRGSDYRRALNEHLFGLPADQYSALVDALLQLRRPQLSKQLNPEELSHILTASLPPLDSAVIGSLAEGFERLDRHRTEREAFFASLSDLKSFLQVYKVYVGSFVKARAQELTHAESGYHAARADVRSAEEKLGAADQRLIDLTETLRQLEQEAVELEGRLEALKSSEEYQAVQTLDAAEKHAASAQRSAQSLADAASNLAKMLERLIARVEGAKREAGLATAALEQEVAQALNAAREAGMEVQHTAVLAALPQNTSVEVLSTSVRLRRHAITQLGTLVRKLGEAELALGRAIDRRVHADDRSRATHERLAEAEALEERAREAFVQDVQHWAEQCRELRLDPNAFSDLAPEAMRPSLAPFLAPARADLEEAVTVAKVALAESGVHTDSLRAEMKTLAAERHRLPPAPPWRGSRVDRPGAPLYLLCDFRETLDDGSRAGLEAALEASGLLDAWVTPDGQVLSAETFDVALVSAPVGGVTLLEVLAPLGAGSVPAEVTERVLRSVAWVPPGGNSDCTAWVSGDGRFSLGPLSGTYRKGEAAFIGATARERARQRRLSELALELEALERLKLERETALTGLQARRRQLEAELDAFPDLEPLRNHQATSRARAGEAKDARAAQAEAEEQVHKFDQIRAERLSARDREATTLGLRGWVDRLPDLERKTLEYESVTLRVVGTHDRARAAQALVQTHLREVQQEQLSLDESAAAARQAREDALRATANSDTLREKAGSTRDQVLGKLRDAERRQKVVREATRTSRENLGVAQQDMGGLRAAVDMARETLTRRDSAREEKELSVQEAARLGLFALAGVELDKAPQEWSYTDALLSARRADEAMAKVDPSESARDRAWNRVSERHQELMRGMRSEIRIHAEQLSGVTVYKATFNARALTLLELSAELEADVAARDRLLGNDERKLFESFLTGETHEHLREKLRQAHALVKRINLQLEAHPTSSGMQMRLDWQVADEAAPGTREAVNLLFKSGGFLSDSDRDALGGFLRQRLDEARSHSGAHSLQEQLLTVLDYRSWHRFHVEFRSAAAGWKRLTRKVHAAGSGGQKAVMLHLPLFAAAAAFYDSARSTAPRLILLDEAFAGIDRETRGQLMGLLAHFDLDFVMTSFEEWGFYPQLDGLSTYQLAREKGMPGVYSDWFIWNGREATQIQ